MAVDLTDPKVIALGIRVGTAFAADDWDSLKSIAEEAVGVDPELKKAIDLYIADPSENYTQMVLVVGLRGIKAATTGDVSQLTKGSGAGSTPGQVASTGPSAADLDAARAATLSRQLARALASPIVPDVVKASLSDPLLTALGANPGMVGLVDTLLDTTPAHLNNIAAGLVVQYTTPADPITLGDTTLNAPVRLGTGSVDVNFATPTDVLYGADGSFIVRRGVQGAVTLAPAQFGNLDPAPGQVKYFYRMPRMTFKKVAGDGESYTNSDPNKSVLYLGPGALGVMRMLTGTVGFNPTTFKVDPAPLLPKVGYVQTSAPMPINYKDFLAATQALSVGPGTDQMSAGPTGEGLLSQQGANLTAEQRKYIEDAMYASQLANRQAQGAAQSFSVNLNGPNAPMIDPVTGEIVASPTLDALPDAPPASSSVSTAQVVATGGGAALGFMVYGPLGAAVGAAAGWLLGGSANSSTTKI